jgi:predicted glycosyltransferase
MLHSFRVPNGIDYVKLPCVRRDETGNLGVRYIRDMELKDTIGVRREILLSVIKSFRPDVLLVDKKPSGLAGELKPGIQHLKLRRPNAKVVLLLRDILDSPSATIDLWKQQGHYDFLETYYDAVLVLGQADLFDVCAEYRFPAAVRNRVKFCGYIRREPSPTTRETIRRGLNVSDSERVVVVTTGGGEDGYDLIRNYILGLEHLSPELHPMSVVITGPDLESSRRNEIVRLANEHQRVMVIEFTDDMMAFLDAADVVVSMGGYNTICEILSLRKRAVVVPRVKPVSEQWIRAERMAARGLFRAIHPDRITPETLMKEVSAELLAHRVSPQAPATISMDALPRIAALMDRWSLTTAIARDVPSAVKVGAGI